MIMTPQQISDALTELLASGDVEEVKLGLFMLTAKGMARAQRMLDREIDRIGGRGAAMPPPVGGVMNTAPRPENESETPPRSQAFGETSIPPQPGGNPAGPFSDSEGGRESDAILRTDSKVRSTKSSVAANPALYTVAMSYISLIVKLGEMDAITFREIEKQIMKDERLSDFERKTVIIPLLDARWRYLAVMPR